MVGVGILPGAAYPPLTGAPAAWRRHRKAKGDEADPGRATWLSLSSRRCDSDRSLSAEGRRAGVRPASSFR